MECYLHGWVEVSCISQNWQHNVVPNSEKLLHLTDAFIQLSASYIYTQTDVLKAKQSWGTDWINVYRSVTLSLQGVLTPYLPLTQSYLYVLLCFSTCHLEASSHFAISNTSLLHNYSFPDWQENRLIPSYLALVQDLMSVIFSPTILEWFKWW